MTKPFDNSADPLAEFEGTLVQHAAFLSAYTKVDHVYQRSLVSSKPVCLLVFGESRTGKTTLLKELELSYPRIRHEESLEVPVLRVSTPSKPTVIGLAEAMLSGLGDPRYYNGSEIQKTERLKTLLAAAKTQVVAIDEVHHFVDKASLRVAYHAADWLKILVDATKVGLVVAGLRRGKVVIDNNEQLRGRFLAPVEMPRFVWTNKKSRSQFVGILAAFHESISRFIDVPEFASTNMAFRFYVGCGGLIGYVTLFLETLVWDCIVKGAKKATLNDMYASHVAAVWSEHGHNAGPNPFTRKFCAEPNEVGYAAALRVGKETQDQQSRARSRPAKSGKNSMNNVLRT